MNHSPTPKEQSILDDLLEQFRFEAVSIRLTKTMLSKSIIDARAPLQTLLKRSGLVEYTAIGRGAHYGVRVSLPLVSPRSAELRQVNFYRPRAKKGDPRVSVEKLSRIAHPGDLLVFAFSGATVTVVLLTGASKFISQHLEPHLPSRFEERGRIERTVRRLMGVIHPLRHQWIKTRRPGPTGVGYTLESLLSIKANVSQAADVDGVELKAYRHGGTTSSNKLVSLFAKTPDWEVGLKRKEMVLHYGYNDPVSGRQQLYCTITGTRNSLGWRLKVQPEAERILVEHKGVRVTSYRFSKLEKRLQEKHPYTLFIRASHRGKGEREEFRYDDVTLCRQPSFANFLDLIEDNAVGLDLTLSMLPNGKVRDHGFLWRIREPRITELFAYRRALSVSV